MTDNNNETYLMLDIEVTGPISAYHSMIEFAVWHRFTSKVSLQCGEWFSVSLKEFDHKGGVWRWDDKDTFNVQDSTYKWWHSPERIATLCQIEAEAIDPVEGMVKFAKWLDEKKFRNPTMVAFGPDLEWLILYWWEVFKDKPPFGLMAVDGKSYAMATCDLEFRHTSNRMLRQRVPWLFDPMHHHTHRALDDAEEQAFMFERLQEINKNRIDNMLRTSEKLTHAQELLLSDEMEVKRQLMSALITIEELEKVIAEMRKKGKVTKMSAPECTKTPCEHSKDVHAHCGVTHCANYVENCQIHRLAGMDTLDQPIHDEDEEGNFVPRSEEKGK